VFIHSVYFWLKEGLTADQVEDFRRGLQSLTAISSVKQSYIGIPAETDREVIDNTYSYALIVIFDDLAGHDQYQVDPVHDRFRDESSANWSKVLIYDAQE
jgi:hypothetical protein